MNDPFAAPRLAAITVSGPDAQTFLQGQLSADVTRVTNGQIVDAAWLTPAGRVIALVQIAGMDGAFALFLPAGLLDPVLKRLTMFRLRAAVTLAAEPAWGAGRGPAAGGLLAERTLAGANAAEHFAREPAHADAHWHTARLAAGYPWIDAANTETYTAHQLNLDLIGAVSLSKGCYSGQEIVARTTHRGRTKRRALRFRIDGPAPAAGADVVSADGAKQGTVVSAARAADEPAEVLALVAVDQTEPLHCDGLPLTPAPLPFAIPAIDE